MYKNIYQYMLKNSTIVLSIILIILYMLIRLHSHALIGEENKYASAAWQMFYQNNWLIPKLGKTIYPDKPPLLYWIIMLGWHVNIKLPWVIIVPSFFAIMTVILNSLFYKKYFSPRHEASLFLPFMLLSLPFFLTNIALMRFDMLITFFNLLACYGIFLTNRTKYGYLLFALSNALGVLSKGPIIYIFTISNVLAYIYVYKKNWHKEGIKFGLAIILSLLLICAWIIPAILKAGHNFAYDIIISQNIGRMIGKVGNSNSMLTYIPILIFMFFPWLFLKQSWYGEKYSDFKNKLGLRKCNFQFLFISIIIPTVFLSIISCKEVRYLLPLTPFVAICINELVTINQINQYLLIGYQTIISILIMVVGIIFLFSPLLIHDLSLYIHIPKYIVIYFPFTVGYLLIIIGIAGYLHRKFFLKYKIYVIAVLCILCTMSVNLAYESALSKSRNLKIMSVKLKMLQKQHQPIVSLDNIVNWMQFAGKMVPIPVITKPELTSWLAKHPDGWVLLTSEADANNDAFNKNCFHHSYNRLNRIMFLCPGAFLCHWQTRLM